jgi:hypothetical protein
MNGKVVEGVVDLLDGADTLDNGRDETFGVERSSK